MPPLCCASPISSRWPRFCSTRRPAITISMSPCSSCATRKSPPKASCPPVRTPAPPSSWVKKASASGPAAATKPPWRRACTTPIPKITCATHRTPRWICIKRSTPAPTCRRRSISTASTATNINSCAWRKAAVPPIKPISIRKPKR